MIANPHPGQRVRLHYAQTRRVIAPFHGREGIVEIAGRGRPRNHGVRLLPSGPLVVVPGGNLVAAAVGGTGHG